MIEPELLEDVSRVYVHKNPNSPCPDGVASALILRQVLPNAEIVFVSHEEAKTIEPEEGSLWCDVTPPEERADAWFEKGALLLDHHVSAEKIVRRFEEANRGVFADAFEDPGVSGALLAFRHVYMPRAYPDGPSIGRRHLGLQNFATLAGVRDTWQKDHPWWRDACAQAAALVFWPWEKWPRHFYDECIGVKANEMLRLGYVLEDRREERTREIAREAYRTMSSSDTRIAIVPTRETSDVSELLANEADLTIGFAYTAARGRTEIIVSLRSRGEFDCAAFAKAHGGGGHRNAAGFTVPVSYTDPGPYAFLIELVEAYEKRASLSES